MKKLLLLTFCIGLGYLASAQPQNPSNPVPLDGGLSLLAAAGAAYGFKKYRDSKKES